jgi:hypothetical protein
MLLYLIFIPNHFEQQPKPILFLDKDFIKPYEWAGA